ncbi:MAG: glycosyltransferase family 4 protein [Halobellus sp.]|uniref:glycosyltransferase family 4 protein n=1 Tax=Halobellus sp. TaxID=1979212 RepID=UPI0035D4217D
MTRVAVLHNTLDFQGGADVVCLSVCAALQRDYEVTLFTLSETDPGALAERFDIDLDPSKLAVRPKIGAETVGRLLSSTTPIVGPQLPFRSVLLREVFERYADRYDLAVSTANELSVSLPSVQYVHYPQYNRHRLQDAGADATDGVLHRVWSRLAAPSRAEVETSVSLLANSGWTADVVEEAYGVEPAVVHPPIDPIEGGPSWEAREDGVVVVGRIAPDKRLLNAIEIVEGVRDRGHDLHVHIVGGAPRAYRDYVEQVESAAEERSYVFVERDVPRARIEELLLNHRYGLNCKPKEHFGMSVAEYVAAGMVAFAPDSGGQREILAGRDDRLFDSTSAAVDRLAVAMENGDRPELAPDRFSTDRFEDSIRRAVQRRVV